MKKILIALCGGLILSSCTWVKVTAKGESVRLVQSVRAVEPCKKLGQISTKVVSQVIFNRDPETVASELADLARNEAALMGGDTIVPASDIFDGRRSFGVYQCFQSRHLN
jgi:hypothetical protein